MGTINVYFISGLSANCHVFDKLKLPNGYKKIYIEWIIPQKKHTLEEYALLLSKKIETTQPFILVGYSFGGIIIQEMNNFLKPIKNIIIASIKSEREAPPLFRFGHRIKFAERFPLWQLIDNKKMQKILARVIYRMKDIDMFEYVSYTNATYMQWSVDQILKWKPSNTCPNLYHIHGTYDNTFPSKYIQNANFIEGGDHFMVFKKPIEVSNILNRIITKG